MDGALRHYLKTEIDKIARGRLQATNGRVECSAEGYCRGCGGAHELWTLDCDTCKSRHYGWHKRGTHPDPAYYQRRLAERIAHAASQRAAGFRFDGTFLQLRRTRDDRTRTMGTCG